MEHQSLRKLAAGLILVTLLLVACGTPAAGPTAFVSPAVTYAPATSAAIGTPPATVPKARTTATPGPDPGGLTGSQARTLESLTQVDEYPLYTMTYYGAYDLALLPAGEGRASEPGWACSLFAALADGPGKLYGRNFDWQFSPAVLLFTDPGDGYASVSMVDIAYLIDDVKVGSLTDLPIAAREPLLDAPLWPFDGMNEQGLAVGMAAVPEEPLPHDPSRESIGSLGIIREMLDHAANVDQALEILQSYDLAWGGGPALHYLIADASGRAVLVEFYDGEMVVLPNEDAWHLATNHLRAEVAETGGYACARYDKLQERLKESDGWLDPEGAMTLLADVAQQNTQWSVVYGLEERNVHVAMGGEYGSVHSFGLGSGGD